VVWGTLAGISGVIGVGFFYLALARGTMGIVAPLAAVIGAGLPVLVAIIGGETASISRLAGMAVALLAVVLISLPRRGRDEAERRAIRVDVAELPLILMSGLGFAGFFIGVDRASAAGATWWPLVFVRLAGFALVTAAFLVLLLRREGPLAARATSVLGMDRLRASGRGWAAVLPLFVITGIGDMGGNGFFVLARHADAFSIAVVLSSLYPVVTTVLAALLLHERLSRAQLLGVALATLSVPLLR
jgi:drug/metabolite transporter (DMT)-like permease